MKWSRQLLRIFLKSIVRQSNIKVHMEFRCLFFFVVSGLRPRSGENGISCVGTRRVTFLLCGRRGIRLGRDHPWLLVPAQIIQINRRIRRAIPVEMYKVNTHPASFVPPCTYWSSDHGGHWKYRRFAQYFSGLVQEVARMESTVLEHVVRPFFASRNAACMQPSCESCECFYIALEVH